MAFINTGRPYHHIDQRVIDIGFDGFICSCGSYIRYKDEVIYCKTLDQKLCTRTVELIRKCKLDAKYETIDGVYFDLAHPMDRIILDEKYYMEAMGFDTTSSIDSIGYTFDKFVFWIREDSNLSLFKEVASKDFDLIFRKPPMVEVVPRGLSKATGMEFLLIHLHASKEDTYAFGDGHNDLPMLLYAGTSILMGSGATDLFDKVSYVTKGIMENGIEFALKQYGLI